MKKTAREYTKDFISKFVEENFEQLSKINKELTEPFLKDLIKNEIDLDWVIFEVLIQWRGFREYLVSDDICKEEHDKQIIILYLKNRYVRIIFKFDKEYLVVPMQYEFVHPVWHTVKVLKYLQYPKSKNK